MGISDHGGGGGGGEEPKLFSNDCLVTKNQKSIANHNLMFY